MRIIIIGATLVGTELAEYLVHAGHAVTLIDTPSDELTQIANRLDLRVIQGDPTAPAVLREAGARNTELLVATSASDEVNITTCCVASYLFDIPRKIARLRAPGYFDEADKLFGPSAIPIDHIISPEQLMADAVNDLMEIPGVNAIQSFARDRIILTSVTCQEGGKLIDQPITQLEEYEPKSKVIAVYRRGTPITKFERFTFKPGDEVVLSVERTRALNLVRALMPLKPSGLDVVVQGGTHIADSVALRLSERYHVKLIEPDANRAKRLAERLRGSKVELFCADATDPNFVQEEKLYQSDTFIAASSNDESNIMAALMLQRTQRVRTIAVIRQLSTQDLNNAGSPIDTIISPRDAIISALLSLILQEGLVKMRIFRHGQAEALELLVQGDQRSSHVIGRKLEDLNLPPGVVLGMALREKVVLKIDQDYVFTAGDHVVAYLTDRMHMRALVKLFKPRAFWVPRWR
ncbi:MAG TPA: Trk system potassium transporter TrkA [Candidatus Anaerobiospirillum stercoravium]|nr:Trk system potassium transporter TrkA [Candidatus Anaerobiospirillum stercoravium]